VIPGARKVHPLFPLRDEEDPADYPPIGFVHVTRYEAGGQVWAPRLFTADELQDQSDVTQMFGGGRYELIARDPDKTSIVRREAYNLAGPARPLSVDTQAGFGAYSAPPPAPAPSAASSSGPDLGFMPLLLAMMQNSAQQAATAAAAQSQLFASMMQAQGQQSAQMTQVLVAALSSNRQDPAAFVEAAAKLAAAGGGGGSGGQFAAFKDGMQTAFGLSESADDPPARSDMQEFTEGLTAAASVIAATNGAGLAAGAGPAAGANGAS